MANRAVQRLRNELLVAPSNFSPSNPRLKVVGTFNPAVARYRDEVVLLVRVAEAALEKQPGHVVSPKIEVCKGTPQYSFEVHPVRADSGEAKPSITTHDLTRLPFVSHLQIVRLDVDGYAVRSIETHPQLFGRNEYEEFGLEDPRMTRLGDTYYVTYVAVSRKMNICTCLMSTPDFKSFERHGVIFPCENKDVVLHPESFDGFYACYHRPVARMEFVRPSMVVATSPNLTHWGDHRTFLAPRGEHGWDSLRIGGGTPPMRTSRGWLQIYHGVGWPKGVTVSPRTVEYAAGAVLTSLYDPTRPIARSEEPLLRPELPFERKGYVGNVVFPTGWVRNSRDSDKVIIYYGCADSGIAAVTLSLERILDSLTPLL